MVGIATDVWSIVKSSKPLRRTTQVVSGWALASAGCRVGGRVGAGIGTAGEPGLGTIIGGVGACIGGGIIGYLVGSKVAGYVYDWAEDTFFTPLASAEGP